MTSIFSKIINRQIPAHIIAEDDQFIAFLDVNPLVEGHTLVIPKKEIDYLFDLDDAHLSALMVFAKKVAQTIEKVIPCARIGLSVIGLEVPHAHIHLVPISSMNDLNFTRAKKNFTSDQLADTAARIRAGADN